MKDNYLRELFIEEFVRTLISFSKIRDVGTVEEIILPQITEQLSQKETTAVQAIMPPLPEAPKSVKKIAYPSRPTPVHMRRILKPQQIMQNKMQEIANKPTNIQTIEMKQEPIRNQKAPQITTRFVDAPAMKKIDPIIRNPSVISLECPGPGKNIIVNTRGIMQTTSITLTKEEISDIMKEISEKTRIPLVSGVFKALFGDLLVLAVISEFVGTRFILQKRYSLPSTVY